MYAIRSYYGKERMIGIALREAGFASLEGADEGGGVPGGDLLVKSAIGIDLGQGALAAELHATHSVV